LVQTKAPAAWLSTDAARAAAERFFLLYTPVWIACVAVVMLTGWVRQMGDVGLTGVGLLVAVPPIVLPWFVLKDARARAYANRFNLWIFVFSVFGNYFACRYFEDVLGLRYGFPTTWNVGALVVGKHQVPIPITMYLLTHAYFLTYHAAILVVWRRFGRSVPMLVLLCCFFAFAETASMATPLLKGLFWYESQAKMLTIGTLMYGSLFLVSAPMIARVEPRWPYARVLGSVLAANMLQFWIFEIWARLLL
jgi:cycloeucalenol cycloisomerase